MSLKTCHAFLLTQNAIWPTSLELELVIVIFTLNACLSGGRAEARAYRERGSAAHLAQRRLLASNSSSSLQTAKRKAPFVHSRIFPDGKDSSSSSLPEPLAQKTNRIFKLLSFQLAPGKEHQRFSPPSPTHRHVVFTYARPNDTLPGETQLLWNVFEGSFLKANRAHLWMASSAGNWIKGEAVSGLCVCVRLDVYYSWCGGHIVETHLIHNVHVFKVRFRLRLGEGLGPSSCYDYG